MNTKLVSTSRTPLLFLLIVCHTAAFGQPFLPDRTAHPDGSVGKPSLTIEAAYTSVSGDRQYRFDDISSGRVTAMAVLAPSLVLGAGWQAYSQSDSTRMSVTGLLYLYPGNPLSVDSPGRCNPDGRVGLPVLQAMVGGELADGNRKVERFWLDGALIVPLSPHLSLGAGYRWMEERLPTSPERGYGLLRWYSRPYRSGELYENPDGTPGSLSLELLGGASSSGTLGRLDLAAPLDATTTIGIGAGFESLKYRSETHLTTRVSLSWYPY